MIGYLKSHLSAKMLVVLAFILVVSFALLGFSVSTKQGVLLSEMRERVYSELVQTGEDAGERFGTLEKSVGKQLQAMGNDVAKELTAATEKALSEEEGKIRKGMEKLLLANGEAAAGILSKVAQESIMAKNYEQLVEFSRAVTQTDEIVFAFFLDQDKKILPGYINLVDDRVIGYLEKMPEEYDYDNESIVQATTVLGEARKDQSVLLFEKTVEYYNLPIGTILIGLNEAVIAKEIDSLASRFEALKAANSTSITQVIEVESRKVVAEMADDLSRVSQQSSEAIERTGGILAEAALQVKSGTQSAVLVVGLLCCLGVIGAVAIMLRLMVIKPILEVTEGLRDTAEGEGDLTKRLSIGRTDEIGMLAKWFDTFVAKLNDIIVDIGGNSETVSSSAFETLTASEQMQEEASGLKEKANVVASASEGMTMTMNSVAATCEQAATNIGFVATAAVDMREALQGVVTECDRAKVVAHKATEQVHTATDKVTQLGEAANEISNVSQVITDIADQTNLLALNATIEAARAGEAGKGFAVVAGEIKALANQTQEATQQIKTRIDLIQGSTNETVEEVGLISQVIEDVDQIMSSIADSMTTQSDKASEVADNIEQASLGISDVNEHVAQSSIVTAKIASDIGVVNDVAEDMSSRVGMMRESSEDLSELSNQLKTMISIFKVRVSEDGSNKNAGAAGKRRSRTIPELFPWSNRLVTGMEDIDNQHRKLVRLVNELHKAMKLKVGAEESGRILGELAEYTRYHFEFEEKLFTQYKYPVAVEHKKKHKDLVAKVIAFQNDFKQGKAGLSVDLMNFLASWLRDHIMKTDMEYVSFFKSKGL